jgi:hypothetical protein
MYKKIYELPCVHTKVSQITQQKLLLRTRHQVVSEVSVLRTPTRIVGLGVSAT